MAHGMGSHGGNGLSNLMGRLYVNRLYEKRFLGHVDRRSTSSSPDLGVSARTNSAGFRGGVGADLFHIQYKPYIQVVHKNNF